MSASAYALREVPLSDSPRNRVHLAPRFEARYLGPFTVLEGAIVGLDVQGTYNIAREACNADAELVLERDHDNEHDVNAVAAYWTRPESPLHRGFVGHLDATLAATIAPEMDQGAVLRARPLAHPYSGKESKGGSMAVELYLVED